MCVEGVNEMETSTSACSMYSLDMLVGMVRCLIRLYRRVRNLTKPSCIGYLPKSATEPEVLHSTS